MENKKLVKILTKDLAELEELIAEIKTRKHFELYEMEFVHTRVKGVLHMMQLLNTSTDQVLPPAPDDNIKLEELKENVEKVSELTSDIKPVTNIEVEENKEDKEKPLPGIIPEPEKKQEEPKKPDESPVPGIVPQPPKESDDKQEEERNLASPINVDESSDDDLVLEDIPEKVEVNSRLGDSFLKNRSVNDLISGKVKHDYKFSNRPVPTIQSAIGINDRFQYIRELFNGDNKKYLETVKTLDSMDNIKQAVEYLRNNFKWKKNDTSLKFVDLVKRRFQNTPSAE